MLRHSKSVLVALGLGAVTACGASPESAENGGPQEWTQSSSSALTTIDPAKELLINDLSVVNDPGRTVWKGGQGNDGAWTFGRLMMAMAGTDKLDAAADFVEHWLEQWEVSQTFNGVTAPARLNIQTLVIDPWPKTANGKLDLTKAPFRLLAVVHRPDLRNVTGVGGPKQEGEGRFVFGVIGAAGNAMPFTVIFEYGIPAASPADVRTRAKEWHELGNKVFGTDDFNSTVQRNTDKFAKRNACDKRVNGSCINQIRTNEVSLGEPGTDPANTPSTKLWELREFRLNPSTGQLDQSPVAQSVDVTLRGTPALADFINSNESDVVAQKHRVPATMLPPSALAFKGAFLGGEGINNPEARFGFAVNTCEGCHTTETGTSFLHIRNRDTAAASLLSGFLTGTTAADPVTGQPRSFGALSARAADLQWVLFTATDVDLGKAPPKTAPH